MKLNAKQLREVEEINIPSHIKRGRRRPIYFILENIYDTYNVGGLYRLADALNISKIYLCGDTDTPPNSRIKKASIGTYKVVPWEYRRSSAEAIAELRKPEAGDEKLDKEMRSVKKIVPLPASAIQHPTSILLPQIIAVEQDKRAVEYTKADYSLPLALVLGNETYGVLPETLKLCDQIVEIPMWGINKSLNVIVSAAIVSYFAAPKITE